MLVLSIKNMIYKKQKKYAILLLRIFDNVGINAVASI